MNQIVVVGSVNLDVVLDVDRLPRAGETVIARGVRTNLGGKGANQAAAARISAGGVTFVGRVGADDAGVRLRDELSAAGVHVDLLAQAPGVPSGVAYIQVGAGDNTIVVASGANATFTELAPAEVDAVRAATVVVCQLEIPDPVVEQVAQVASGRLVLNAAPARPLPDAVTSRCDPLVVNETELAEFTGTDTGSVESVLVAAQTMRAQGVRSVVVTLGGAGAVWVDAGGSGHHRASAVPVVDTTGAGDLFVGTLAAQLAAGAPLSTAVSVGTAVASLSVTRPGTIASYPTPAEVAAVVAGVSTR
ncbi:ribokinase [Williamsia sp. CHRR-6]|uniref:ribokinase n=1 Tax=Williamsia sp. CHRR-6 TaxID=2835871 RepID=UPI001BD99848|nr:ribokinase [Williamsia sp. CHRR-6]MBT0566635.1 ribokinase [Williamsia sp. CHRR-6]